MRNIDEHECCGNCAWRNCMDVCINPDSNSIGLIVEPTDFCYDYEERED